MPMSEIKSYNVKAGSDGRIWEVVVKEKTEDYIEFIVKYPEKEKAKIVKFDGEWECNGTYAQYNETCPHKEACKEVMDRTVEVLREEMKIINNDEDVLQLNEDKEDNILKSNDKFDENNLPSEEDGICREAKIWRQVHEDPDYK